MRKEIALPTTTSYKWYSFSEIKEGVNQVFRYRFNVKTKKNESIKMYIYYYNGVFLPNTFTSRLEGCTMRFNEILKSKGDISKISFECFYKLELIN
jgi:hypothetical protein